MGVQSDVPRDCRTFKLYASGCGREFCYVCVFLLLEESDNKSWCNTTGLNCYVEFCECSSFYWARTPYKGGNKNVCPADVHTFLLNSGSVYKHYKTLQKPWINTMFLTAPFNNMRTLKFKAQPTNAFFATVDQMFDGSSQLPTTAEHCFVVWTRGGEW